MGSAREVALLTLTDMDRQKAWSNARLKKAIREAGLEEIKKVPGVNAPAAEAIYAWAHPEGANAEA